MQGPQTFAILTCAMASLPGLCGCSRPPPVDREWLGTITMVDAPTAAGARYPHLATAPGDATAVMSWLEPADEGVFLLRHARWSGNAWGPAATIARGRDWFVNWADFPSVVPVTPTLWAAHWLQQKPGNVYSYDVRMTVSTDSGEHWSAPFTPHDDATPTEHGFVSIVPRAGQPYAVWLDGRNTAGETHGHASGHTAGDGAMTLRGAVIEATDARDGAQIDGRVCDCCQTDAVQTADATLVVYRDRSDDETRDILAARLDGTGWSTPALVHADGWRIEACPVNGPAAAARGDAVAVAWFTAPDQPRVRLAFSTDGGREFSPAIEVASGRVIGRVDVVLLADGRAIVSWLEEAASGAEVRAQPFTAAGPAGAMTTIAQTASARSAGFPQMLLAGDRLLFAWTETGGPPRIRTASAALE